MRDTRARRAHFVFITDQGTRSRRDATRFQKVYVLRVFLRRALSTIHQKHNMLLNPPFDFLFNSPIESVSYRDSLDN